MNCDSERKKSMVGELIRDEKKIETLVLPQSGEI
jgi:hypothetical protein